MRVINALTDKLLRVFVGLCLGVLVVVTFGQVVGRYFLGISFGWAEELCVVIFCWMVWPTACLLLLANQHLSMTVVVSRMSVRVRRVTRGATHLATAVFLAMVIYSGLGAMDAMADISFISLPGPLNLKFSSVPVGGALMLYYLLRIMLAKGGGEHGGG